MYIHTTKYKASKRYLLKHIPLVILYLGLYLFKEIEFMYTFYMYMRNWMPYKGGKPDTGLSRNLILIKHKINSTVLLSVLTE